ncbi:MAG TPA: ABC-2 transporter permease [Patescibacteria group bacterium]|nr:ABC-2 transporter permease [Patescibacteria group bacterium]
MIGIMKIHMKHYLFYPPLFLALISYYWLTTRDSLHINIAIMNSIFIYFVSVIPAVMIEIRDEANHGYAFLGTLPVTVREIVTAKFILVLACVAVLVLYNFVLFTFFDSTPEMLATCRSVILLNASLSLIITGIMFLVIFRFGAMVFLVLSGVVLLLFNMLGLVAFKTLPAHRGLLSGFNISVEGYGWVVIVCSALAAYYGLMRLAVRIKSARSG